MTLLPSIRRTLTGQDSEGRWLLDTPWQPSTEFGRYEIHQFTVTNTGPGPVRDLVVALQPGRPRAGMTPAMILPSDALRLREHLSSQQIAEHAEFQVPVAILRTGESGPPAPWEGRAASGARLLVEYRTLGRSRLHTASLELALLGQLPAHAGQNSHHEPNRSPKD